MERIRASVAAGLAAAGAGCTPLTLSVGLGPTPRVITEVLVTDEPGKEKIALIDVRGMISDMREPGLAGPGANALDVFVSQLGRAEQDPLVRGVVIRINSPGGTVTASDIAYLEVRRFAERTGKPVVVSLGDVAASGGYYLALAGDEIIAQPTSLTGSIGVVIPLMNFSEGLGRLGIVSTAITSGPNKDMGNPFEAREAAHEALYQGLVDEFYSRFRGLVESRRGGIPPGSLEAATDGRIMTGARALEWGLVDSLGGIAEAMVSVKRRAGLTHADVVKYSGSVGRTRSAYAEGWSTPVEAPASPAVEVNVLNLGRGPGSMPNAYYLWTGPG